jgi:hypothetical protein
MDNVQKNNFTYYNAPSPKTFKLRLIYIYCCDGVRLRLYGTGPLMAPLSIPQITHEWTLNSGGMIMTDKKRKELEKNLSQCHSVDHKDWPGRTNPGLHGGKPATSRLSHRTPISERMLQLELTPVKLIKYGVKADLKANCHEHLPWTNRSVYSETIIL